MARNLGCGGAMGFRVSGAMRPGFRARCAPGFGRDTPRVSGAMRPGFRLRLYPGYRGFLACSGAGLRALW